MYEVQAEVPANEQGAIKVAEKWNEILERRVNTWNFTSKITNMLTLLSPIMALGNYAVNHDWEKALLATSFGVLTTGPIALYSSWKTRKSKKQLYENYKEMFGMEVHGSVELTRVRHKARKTIEQLA